MYGTEGVDGSFGANCLLARRLAERGVRFIQLYHRDWDHHGAIKEHVKGTAAEVDQGAAALDQRPQTARNARRDAGDLGRRVRPDARWPRATAATTTSRAFRSGWPAAASRGASPTAQTDEFGYSRRARRRSRPRPARHDPGPLRHRPHQARLSLPGPRLPADRRRRPGCQADPGVTKVDAQKKPNLFGRCGVPEEVRLVCLSRFRLFSSDRGNLGEAWPRGSNR